MKGEKFLGFLVRNRKIEPNHEKIQVIINITSSQSMKDI